MHVHVCHKCGLPRKNESDVELGQCECIGQTEFEYEEKERSIGEAVEIGVKEYLNTVNLYLMQSQEAEYYKKLAERYKYVIQRDKAARDAVHGGE